MISQKQEWITWQKFSSKQRERQTIKIALPCQICEELCPSDKLIDLQLQCRKERENAKRRELKDTSFQAQEFAFNEYSTELGKLSGRWHCSNLASRPCEHKTSFHREWGKGTGGSIWKSLCYSTMSWGNRWDSHWDQTTRNEYNRLWRCT